MSHTKISVLLPCPELDESSAQPHTPFPQDPCNTESLVCHESESCMVLQQVLCIVEKERPIFYCSLSMYSITCLSSK